MTKEEKALVIDGLASKLAETSYFYLTDASGLSVSEVNDLRRKCFENGVEYKVYKNTLIKKAFDKLDNDYSELESVLKGFTGIMFSPEVGNLPAKVLKEVKGNAEKPSLKGAWIDTDIFIGADQLDTLCQLKSKVELIGEVITLLQSPAQNVISGLQSGGAKLAGILSTLAEKEEA